MNHRITLGITLGITSGVTSVGMGCLVVLLSFALSCGKKTDTGTDIEETGQQIGDVMASVDETGGSGGSLAQTEPHSSTFARLAPKELEAPWYEQLGLSSPAYAASCFTASTFGTCTSNVITRTFGDCTIGKMTFSGTVTLTWGGASSSCRMGAAGDSITRVPSFTVTGRRGATLSVSKTGTLGQKVTWASGTGTSKVFSFTNDGIRRAFTDSSSATLFDFTTSTTSAITVTGTSRSSRTMSGGGLRVTNNLTSVTCDYVPSGVTWSNTCNCPVSGSWAGSCSDGKSTTLTLTGCGTASLAIGSESQDVTLDRCYGV